MTNAVLAKLYEQRAEQLASMDAVLSQVEGRDMVDAERSLLEAARQRIGEIDAQIEPLEAFEKMRGAHVEVVADSRPEATPAQPRRMGEGTRDFPYASAGAFLVDYVRAYGYGDSQRQRDDQAMGRVQAAYASRAVANQTTSDTAGILPTPIVGTVVDLIDANRPLVSSLGARPLGGIPGSTFTRPKIVTHTTVGLQPGEKQQLPSQKMSITGVPFTKQTYGGTVDISRQDIDWTSPSAWDILISDLANVYAVQTETAVATAFHGAASGASVPVATDDLKGWTLALYTAAMHSYQGGKVMPDRVWCSLDVWAALGSLVDAQRVILPPDSTVGGDAMDSFDVGGSSLGSFRGDVLGLPRIVVPTLPPKSCIVGPSALYEVYEEVIGLLSVIEPSILGVEVAYGGYVAFGAMAGAAFVPLDATTLTLPTLADVDTDGDAPEGEAKGDTDGAHARRGNGGGK